MARAVGRCVGSSSRHRRASAKRPRAPSRGPLLGKSRGTSSAPPVTRAPVSISTRVTAHAHSSALRAARAIAFLRLSWDGASSSSAWRRIARVSGDAYASVHPRNQRCVPSRAESAAAATQASSASRRGVETPKSVILTAPTAQHAVCRVSSKVSDTATNAEVLVTSTSVLSGFTSQCTKPCACMYANPRAIARAMVAACAVVTARSRTTRFTVRPPGTRSSTNTKSLSIWKAARIPTRFGCRPRRSMRCASSTWRRSTRTRFASGSGRPVRPSVSVIAFMAARDASRPHGVVVCFDTSYTSPNAPEAMYRTTAQPVFVPPSRRSSTASPGRYRSWRRGLAPSLASSSASSSSCWGTRGCSGATRFAGAPRASMTRAAAST
mmetsp:Transcript_10851/g.43939  ORF Transcript_10851/g.43939 Transcript_10851/m.43939 type:complete len:381 (+) Transcript_10851:1205-2347(+)